MKQFLFPKVVSFKVVSTDMSQRIPFIRGELLRESIINADDDDDDDAEEMPTQVRHDHCLN